MGNIKKMKERSENYYWDWYMNKSTNDYNDKHNFDNYTGINFDIPSGFLNESLQ